MSRYSPNVQPMYLDLGSALRAGTDSYQQSRESKLNEDWRKKQEERQRQQDAERQDETEYGKLIRTIELDKQGIGMGARPMDETSVMHGAKIPTVADVLREDSVSPFANRMSQSLSQNFGDREQPQPVSAASTTPESLPTTLAEGLRRDTANRFSSNLGRQLLGGEPVSKPRDLTAEPRYRQITGDFGGAYVDNTRTPEARAKQAEAAKQSDILSTLGSAGLTPAQAKLASMYPNLTPDLLFPKKEAPSPYGKEALGFAVKKAGALAQINAKYATPKEHKEPVLTEGERKNAGFLARLRPAAERLNQFDNAKTLNTLANKAGFWGNWAKTPDGRQLDANARAWVTSVLRPESGAVIGPDEMEQYYQLYIPRPGDDDETLELKRTLRSEAENALVVMAGRAASGTQAPSPTQTGASSTLNEVKRRIAAGEATLEQALSSPSVPDEVKRALRGGR